MNLPNWKLSILWKKVEVPWWIYFYPAPFRGNWLLEIMCRTLLQRYIKSFPSDIDWCVVTVVRYHVCQHFNLAARRSRSFNNWNCKYIHTCLKRSSRIIRLIRSATATFFLPNLWRTSWKSPQSQPLHIVCCDAMAANYACAHFFATCQFIIRSNPATFQTSLFAAWLRERYIFQPDQNTHISKLISCLSIWFGLNQNQIWNTTLL